MSSNPPTDYPIRPSAPEPNSARNSVDFLPSISPPSPLQSRRIFTNIRGSRSSSELSSPLHQYSTPWKGKQPMLASSPIAESSRAPNCLPRSRASTEFPTPGNIERSNPQEKLYYRIPSNLPTHRRSGFPFSNPALLNYSPKSVRSETSGGVGSNESEDVDLDVSTQITFNKPLPRRTLTYPETGTSFKDAGGNNASSVGHVGIRVDEDDEADISEEDLSSHSHEQFSGRLGVFNLPIKSHSAPSSPLPYQDFFKAFHTDSELPYPSSSAFAPRRPSLPRSGSSASFEASPIEPDRSQSLEITEQEQHRLDLDPPTEELAYSYDPFPLGPVDFSVHDQAKPTSQSRPVSPTSVASRLKQLLTRPITPVWSIGHALSSASSPEGLTPTDKGKGVLRESSPSPPLIRAPSSSSHSQIPQNVSDSQSQLSPSPESIASSSRASRNRPPSTARTSLIGSSKYQFPSSEMAVSTGRTHSQSVDFLRRRHHIEQNPVEEVVTRTVPRANSVRWRSLGSIVAWSGLQTEAGRSLSVNMEEDEDKRTEEEYVIVGDDDLVSNRNETQPTSTAPSRKAKTPTPPIIVSRPDSTSNASSPSQTGLSLSPSYFGFRASLSEGFQQENMCDSKVLFLFGIFLQPWFFVIGGFWVDKQTGSLRTEVKRRKPNNLNNGKLNFWVRANRIATFMSSLIFSGLITGLLYVIVTR